MNKKTSNKTEEKPVRCGCGGEAKVDWVLQPDGVYLTGVYCENCGTKTIPFWSMKKDEAIDYAITAWNTAMGERTAKVIEHDASITDTDGYKYHRSEYLCGACKKKVIGGDDYCSHCGAKLDWDEDIPMEYFESGGI